MTISVEIQTAAQAWKIIEQDYVLRLSLVVTAWATEHSNAWNAVFAEGRRRGNSCYWGSALVEMEIADQDKRAEWAYTTCCEIWEVQGRTRSRPFFRAIFEACLQSMFSIGEGSFTHQLELHRTRTGCGNPQDLSTVGAHMKRELSHLRAKWNTKLEIATRDNEYQQRLRQQSMQHTEAFNASLPTKPTSGPERLPLIRRANKGKSQLHRTGLIFGALQSGLKALKYCSALDDRRVRPPVSWTEEGCPSAYLEAYRIPEWRKRIQDEKHRYRKQYDATSVQEREAIIQD